MHYYLYLLCILTSIEYKTIAPHLWTVNLVVLSLELQSCTIFHYPELQKWRFRVSRSNWQLMAVSSSPDTTSSIIREELKKILLSWCCHLKKKKQQKSRNVYTESQMRKKLFKLSYVIRCCYVMISNLSMVTHFLNAARDFALKICQIFVIVAFIIWVFFHVRGHPFST